MSSNIAQSFLHGVSINTLPFTKSSSNTLVGHPCYYANNNELKLQRPNFINGVKAMKADGSDQLRSRPTLKRREPPTAPLGLWDRFPAARTVQQMLDTMDRIMEEPFTYNTSWPSSTLPSNGGEYVRGRTPWEIKELEGEYKMRFDMPGMTKDDVNLWVEEKMLVIKAEKVSKSSNKSGEENGGLENEGEWSAKSYGRYSSRIALQENVEFENIKAQVKDGVLYITIPKASSSNKVFSINVQ